MLYENGNIRYIKAGSDEIIRMIYSAVRDSEWLTVIPEIMNENIEKDPDSFKISYNCLYSDREIEFEAEFLIEGKSDNSVSFSFEGKAKKTFEKNRIGFCILHPVETCAGIPCNIIHPGGTVETLYFPLEIDPHQPFKNVCAMEWLVDGLRCRIDIEGDIFETEDQRNWTDASYKTYCTPLEHLHPVTIKTGETIRQKVTLKVEGNIEEPEKEDTIKVKLVEGKPQELPKIGIGRSSRQKNITDHEIKILRILDFDHYRADLYLFEEGWKDKAASALMEAERLGCPLELALFFDDRAMDQCTDMIDWFSNSHTEISLIILYDKTEKSTPDYLTDALGPLLKEVFPGVRIAAGTNANFAELNRNRPETAQSDYLCYSIHPQEHASDNQTLTENLRGQEYTVRSALNFSKGKGIWISTVNLQRRFNANVSNYELPPAGDGFPPQADSRIMSLYGACWTVGSLKYLCESGVKGITFYETVGERGIIQGDYESRWPDRFPAARGMIFPVFFILRYLAGLRHMKVIKSISSSPLDADCLALTDGTQIRLILVNFTRFVRKVLINGCSGTLKIRELNAESYSEAVADHLWTGEKTEKSYDCSETFKIEPFSICFIKGLPDHNKDIT
ncbi:MAG: hypothetical protein GYA41_04795 [Bacteroidales bacterium]|nr:hypothetical protein [Bacteroidales bacterium]